MSIIVHQEKVKDCVELLTDKLLSIQQWKAWVMMANVASWEESKDLRTQYQDRPKFHMWRRHGELLALFCVTTDAECNRRGIPLKFTPTPKILDRIHPKGYNGEYGIMSWPVKMPWWWKARLFGAFRNNLGWSDPDNYAKASTLKGNKWRGQKPPGKMWPVYVDEFEPFGATHSKGVNRDRHATVTITRHKKPLTVSGRIVRIDSSGNRVLFSGMQEKTATQYLLQYKEDDLGNSNIW